MRRITILILVALVAIVGCQNNSMKVTVEGGGQFPASLAGKWKAVHQDWEIFFEPDGKISYAIVPLGRTRLQPGKDTIVNLVGGRKGVYSAGDWLVTYIPETRELSVNIVIDHFHAQVGPNVVRGNATDFLIGPISADGTTWFASWVDSPQYIVDTNDVKDYELPMDPSLLEAVEVVFEKVSE